jgi:hypothetical protein
MKDCFKEGEQPEYSNVMADEIESRSSYVEQALLHVDPNNRFDLDRFERLDQAELACGFLRSNGIACELSGLPLPGLPADIILWVNAKDAKEAWALLADTERESSQKGDQAA